MFYINFKKLFFWKNHHEGINYKIELLNEDIERIEGVLERARVAKFIKIINYKPGMPLSDDRPNPISLAEIEKRIEALEDEGNRRGV